MSVPHEGVELVRPWPCLPFASLEFARNTVPRAAGSSGSGLRLCRDHAIQAVESIEDRGHDDTTNGEDGAVGGSTKHYSVVRWL